MSLSRELLKWLQSLGLTTQVRNPRRDLANGYAIAEVFSSYYPQDVEMFSFENASSATRKAANWELLHKFFVKKDVPITREMVAATLNAQPDAAVQLLETAYAFLTSKTPTRRVQQQQQPQEAPSPSEDSPQFARPTASKLVKERADIDDTTAHPAATATVTAAKPSGPAEQRAREVITEHERQRERHESVGSLIPTAADAAAQRLRRQTKQATAGAAVEHKLEQKRALTAPTDSGRVQFREVQVRPCDVDPLVLRARAKGATPRSIASRPSSSTSTVRQQQQQQAPLARPATTASIVMSSDGNGSQVIQELSRSIEGTLLAAEFGPLQPVFGQQQHQSRGNALATFAETLPWLPARFVAAVLGDIRGTSEILADALLVPSSPALAQLLSLAAACCVHSSVVVNAEACLLLADIGSTAVAKDAAGAASVLERAAPECVTLLLKFPPRTIAPLAAALLRSLCSADHVAVFVAVLADIKAELPPSTFAACLCELATGGLPAGALDAVWREALGTVAADASDAASVTMCIAAMAEAARWCSITALGDVAKLVATVRAAALRCGWWEAITIVVELVCSIAARQEQSSLSTSEFATTAVDDVIGLDASPAASLTRPLALAMTAVHLSRVRGVVGFEKQLVRVLAALPMAHLRGLFASGTAAFRELCPEAAKLAVFTRGADLLAVALPSLWSTPQAVASAAALLLPAATSSSTAVAIVHACSHNGSSATKWYDDVVVPLRDALYVELCRPAGCQAAAELLEMFFVNAPRQALESMPMLLASATVVAGDTPEAASCRDRVALLLSRIADVSAAHRTAITNLILNLPPGLPHASDLTPTLPSQ